MAEKTVPTQYEGLPCLAPTIHIPGKMIDSRESKGIWRPDGLHEQVEAEGLGK
jgi:hypothetical protein